MRTDVLEVMADEIASRPVGALASFQTWDGGGRRRLDGMSTGRRFDIDREQRAWARANKSELAKYEARHRWATFESSQPERVRAAWAKWRDDNVEHLRAYRSAYAKEHADLEREWGRRKREKEKNDPVRHAKRLASYARHRAKVKIDPARSLAELNAKKKSNAKRANRTSTRNCGACDATGRQGGKS